MTQNPIGRLAALDDNRAITAFSRLLAERPGERVELLRVFRADLPDLYAKWLDHAAGRDGLFGT